MSNVWLASVKMTSLVIGLTSQPVRKLNRTPFAPVAIIVSIPPFGPTLAKPKNVSARWRDPLIGSKLIPRILPHVGPKFGSVTPSQNCLLLY